MTEKRKPGRPKGSRTRSAFEKEFYKCPRLRSGPKKLFNITELAKELKKHHRFVQAMKRAGFRMPNGKATYNDAVKWLHENKMWFKVSIYSELPRLDEQHRPGEYVKHQLQPDTPAQSQSPQAEKD